MNTLLLLLLVRGLDRTTFRERVWTQCMLETLDLFEEWIVVDLWERVGRLELVGIFSECLVADPGV